MKILVSGATGLIGKELITELLTSGNEVKAVARNPKSISFLPQSKISEWKIDKTPLDPQFIAGQDAIVHLAGASVASGKWTEEKKKEILDSRVKGTHEWVEALEKLSAHQRPSVFVCASAIGIYGDRHNEVMDENSERGTGFLADVVAHWEAEAKKIEALGIRVVMLRTGIVLARTGGALMQMKPVILGDGTAWVSWIHLHDEIGLIRFAIENKAVEGPINLTAPHPVKNREFTEALARNYGVHLVPSAPKVVLKAALGEMASMVLGSQRVLPKKAIALGYTFKFLHIELALHDIYTKASPLESFYESLQFIPKTVETVFSYFSDAKNLEKLTPSWLGFQIVKQSTPQIEQGTQIDYQLKIHGVPAKWTTQIEKWEAGKGFTDSQLKGPYSKWVHEHHFYPVDGGTLMTDQIAYKVPLGIFGKLVVGKFVDKDVQKIFDYRTKVINETFGDETPVK